MIWTVTLFSPPPVVNESAGVDWVVPVVESLATFTVPNIIDPRLVAEPHPKVNASAPAVQPALVELLRVTVMVVMPCAHVNT